MRIICPYCGKKQDGNNTTCQFCQAALPRDASARSDPAVGSGGGGEPAGPQTTGLCDVCMRSFPVEELEEYEGRRICRQCRRKMEKKETSLAPALRKAKKPDGRKESVRKRFWLTFLLGVMVLAGLALGGVEGWKAVSGTKAEALARARREFAPIIERSNRAFVILIQEAPDPSLVKHAAELLDQCMKALDSKEVRGVCEDLPPLETFRTGFENVLLTRISCARTLLGKRMKDDPVNAAQARQVLRETQDEAVRHMADLVKSLRYFGLSAEGFVYY